MHREAQKSSLADALCKQCKFEASLPVKIDPSHMIVIDEGSLIHRIPWKAGQTFNDICRSYYSYLKQKYENISQLFLMETPMDQIPKT
ncbi:hypothetical protein DPMN_143610 [Dreissena polymorpha]|uniref:Uncharacterized protein n=1 Tax=Dreissena polymorpha TaxID=45954 RepID=A0A9D4JJU4_DREPO|nr:hypothetical protein DPMN_143610 [Dreissena polymorpha]